MRKLLFLFCMISLTSAALYAQDTIIAPDLARLSLHTDFQGVAKVQWTKESENVWRGEFTRYKTKYTYMAKYDTLGNWLEKNVEIQFAQMPMSAIEKIVSRYNNFKPLHTKRIEVLNRNTIYIVELEAWKPGSETRQTYTLEFAHDGELLNTTTGPLKASAE